MSGIVKGALIQFKYAPYYSLDQEFVDNGQRRRVKIVGYNRLLNRKNLNRKRLGICEKGSDIEVSFWELSVNENMIGNGLAWIDLE